MSRDEDREKEFLTHIKSALDDGSNTLDSATRARLRAARAAAVTAGERPVRWAWPAGAMAITAALALSWSLWFAAPVMQAPPLGPAPGMDQLELLSAGDNLELYSDLEFYRWLAGDNDAG